MDLQLPLDLSMTDYPTTILGYAANVSTKSLEKELDALQWVGCITLNALDAQVANVSYKENRFML